MARLTPLQYDRMSRECFWEYDFSHEEIEKMFTATDAEQKFLFEKILLNSTEMFNDLELFDRDTLHRLTDDYSVPTFNHDHASRRINMVEYYFFGQPLTIEELKWAS